MEIKIRNFRGINIFNLSLPDKVKIVVVVGDNGVGKSSLIEAVAIATGELDAVKAFYRCDQCSQDMMKALVGDAEIEVGTKSWKSSCKFKDGNGECQIGARGAIIYPKQFFYLNSFKYDENVLKDAVDLANKIAKTNRFSEFYSEFLASKQSGKRLYATAVLGSGYAHILETALAYVWKKPRVLMIDDLEGFALHPELLEKFYDFLLSADLDFTLIATQSSDVYAYLADRKLDAVKFLLICNRDKHVVVDSDWVADTMFYKDLRYYALECSRWKR